MSNQNEQAASQPKQVAKSSDASMAEIQFALTPIGQQIKQFETLQRMAKMYTTSTIVPDTYKNNIGNCVIAIDMAFRMNANPLMVMQNLYVVHGNPSFSSKFLIATINASGRFTPLRYEFAGKENTDSWKCRCYAYETSDKTHKEPLYGDWISIEMAKKEGWMGKSGSKWLTMPGQMLRYRAAAFWQRAYAPEISMGFITSEEAEDMADTPDEQMAEDVAANANSETIDLNLDTSAENPAQPETKEAKKEQKAQAASEPEKPKEEKPIGPSDDIPDFLR